MECFLKPFLQEKIPMFDVSNTISVHVLQLPNDKNGKTAIVSASLVMPDGRVINDVCSVSPRSPFEKEDTLELAKNRVINAVKQKAEPISKTIKTSLKMPFRMIKTNSREEETSLPAVVNCPSFATRLRSGGKIQRNLLLPALANSYKTSRDTRLIA